MTEQEALDIWNQHGKGQLFWTFKFAQAVESETLNKVLAILEKYGLSKDQTAKEIRALAASDRSEGK